MERDSNEIAVNGLIADVHVRIYKRIATRMTMEFREWLSCPTKSDKKRWKRD